MIGYRRRSLSKGIRRISDTRNISSPLAMLTSFLGLVGTIGTIVSLIANGTVFFVWGMNFYEIASPSDILMSGFKISSWLIPVFLMIVLASILPASAIFAMDVAFSNFLKKRFPRIDDIPVMSGQGIFKATYLMLLMFFMSSALFFLSVRYVPNFSEWILISLQYFMCVYGAMPLALHYFFNVGMDKDFFRRRSFAIIAMTAIILTETLIQYALTRVPSAILVGQKVDGCSKNLQIVWMGSTSIVLRCSNDRSSISKFDNFIVTERSGKTFSVSRE